MIIYTLAFIFAMSGVALIVLAENYIKKVMGLNIFTNGIHVLLASVGYISNAVPPIATTATLPVFTIHAVDPLPQALIITSIVIDISITAVALGIIIKMKEEQT